jgi:predicted DNA-binding transcriptional regulator YafY
VRRADRLFRIIQRLRQRGVHTARALAEELEVSERTVYRNVRDLILSGVPILGEAGVGYALPRGFDLPPLMFTEEEIEALVLGARVVQSTFGVVLDTSGSMERTVLARALGTIASYATSRDVPAVRVVFCDAAPYDEGYLRRRRSPEGCAAAAARSSSPGSISSSARRTFRRTDPSSSSPTDTVIGCR